MKVFILSIALSLSSLAALSYGDASDGDCSWTGGGVISVSQSVWNCQDIYVETGTTVEFTGTEIVELRAQGRVTIDGTLDVSASGGQPGPGGQGEGTSGSSGTNAGVGLSGGGGGGAGHLNTGTSGNSSDDLIAGGTGGASYGDETEFPNSISTGSGGGAGGAANSGGLAGGAGGAGGGALIIVAKDIINLDSAAVITAAGEAGSPGADDGTNGSGGGGGGSGGSVYIVSNTSIDILGTINVLGGAGGSGGVAVSSGGNGGAGSIGRVRLDAPSVNTAGSNIPAGTVDTLPPPANIADPLSSKAAVNVSDIEYACSYKEAFGKPNEASLSFLFAFALGTALITLLTGQVRWRR